MKTFTITFAHKYGDLLEEISKYRSASIPSTS